MLHRIKPTYYCSWIIIFLIVNIFLTVDCFAQYNPVDEKYPSTSETIIQYGTGFAENIVFVIIIFSICMLLIAGILFITSGGDEDRIDTTIMWTKKSTLSIVVATMLYMGINIIK